MRARDRADRTAEVSAEIDADLAKYRDHLSQKELGRFRQLQLELSNAIDQDDDDSRAVFVAGLKLIVFCVLRYRKFRAAEKSQG